MRRFKGPMEIDEAASAALAAAHTQHRHRWAHRRCSHPLPPVGPGSGRRPLRNDATGRPGPTAARASDRGPTSPNAATLRPTPTPTAPQRGIRGAAAREEMRCSDHFSPTSKPTQCARARSTLRLTTTTMRTLSRASQDGRSWSRQCSLPPRHPVTPYHSPLNLPAAPCRAPLVTMRLRALQLPPETPPRRQPLLLAAATPRVTRRAREPPRRA